MRSNESSVSYFKERLDRLLEPMKVKKGLLAGPGGESHIPRPSAQAGQAAHAKRQEAHLSSGMSIHLVPILSA